MHTFGPEMGGGLFALNFTDFVVVNVQGVFSTHVTHKDSKTVELSGKRVGQGRWMFIRVKINTF